ETRIPWECSKRSQSPASRVLRRSRRPSLSRLSPVLFSARPFYCTASLCLPLPCETSITYLPLHEGQGALAASTRSLSMVDSTSTKGRLTLPSERSGSPQGAVHAIK